ncbi:membrane hypothetical protein [uncultured spirochete]|uniref:O-antigen ligase-related domain-containing protein n=1 Tax=uncultured spirochete TaxID=156406 RepID=A0A3P3XQX4_9SPIR|nr:membrane hypothetical protein [uncultured spirochete]
MEAGSNLKPISRLPVVDWIFIIFWCQEILIDYLLQIYRRIPIIGDITYQAVIPLIFFLLFIITLYARLKVKLIDIVFVIMAMLPCIFALVQYQEAAANELPTFFLKVFPMFFVGLFLNEDKKVWKSYSLFQILYILAITNLIANFLYTSYYLSSRVLEGYSMTWAYSILPSVLMIIFWGVKGKRVIADILSVFGFLLILSYGSRGPIVCVLVFTVLLIAINMVNRKKYSIIVLFCILIVIIMNTNYVSLIVSYLQGIISRTGFSTRVFDMMLRNDILSDTGRSPIRAALLSAISERPLLGYGLYADRYLSSSGIYISGMYAHNFVLELWTQFGVVIGSLIIFAIGALVINAVVKAKENHSRLCMLLIFICVGVVKLFMSGSYLQEPYFFLLIGYCTKIIREKRSTGRVIKYANSLAM